MNNGKHDTIHDDRCLHARAAFDASIVHLDIDSRRRLRLARGHALLQEPRRTRLSWPLPAGAALATALALLVLWPHATLPTPTTNPSNTHATAPATIAMSADTQPVQNNSVDTVEDASTDSALAVGLITDNGDGADPELLGNLEFYGWLANQHTTARSGG